MAKMTTIRPHKRKTKEGFTMVRRHSRHLKRGNLGKFTRSFARLNLHEAIVKFETYDPTTGVAEFVIGMKGPQNYQLFGTVMNGNIFMPEMQTEGGAIYKLTDEEQHAFESFIMAHHREQIESRFVDKNVKKEQLKIMKKEGLELVK